MFFDGWGGLVRVLVAGGLGYLSLVVILRVSGKRTLTKMNAFDLVVTVALGSTLAALVLNSSVALVEGVTALALLIGLQYVTAWMSTRSPRFRELVKSEPTLLARRGEMVRSALRQQRISTSEVLQAVRSEGHGSLDDVDAVVLETDGSMSVIAPSHGRPTALRDVRGIDDVRGER